MAERKQFYSIRNKIIKCAVLSFLAMIAMSYLVLNSIMLDKINFMEEEYTKRSVERTMMALQQDQKHLASILTGWALWDDTYVYMENRDPAYVEKNVTVFTLGNLDIDLMAFADTDQNFICGGERIEGKLEMQPLPANFLQVMQKGTALKNTNPLFRMQGIIMVDQRPVEIAVSPVLPTNGKGIVRGYGLMGAYLEDRRIQALERELDIKIQLKNLDNLPEAERAMFLSMQPAKPVVVKISTEDEMTGYTVLQDIYGEPVLGLTVQVPRTIHVIGHNAIRATMVILMGLCFVFLLAILSFFDGRVLLRLEKISAAVRDIAHGRKFDKRLPVQKVMDELTIVSEDINFMLDALEDAQAKVRENEGKLRIINENLQNEISERRKAQDDIRYMAYHDYLTGLPNRASCKKLLGKAMSAAVENKNILAVLFLDIDGFKKINDTMGHAAGDALLQDISSRLTHTLRRSDTVIRYGGDEFIVLLENLKRKEDIPAVAGKLIACFADPFVWESTMLFVTTSIGISVYPDLSEDGDVLIKSADLAMYKAKTGGKNQYAFFAAEADQNGKKV